jgi:hypothetical protein
LDPAIWIQLDLAAGRPHKADRHAEAQLAAACLRERGIEQAATHDRQLELAHRALEAEQQPIIQNLATKSTAGDSSQPPAAAIREGTVELVDGDEVLAELREIVENDVVVITSGWISSCVAINCSGGTCQGTFTFNSQVTLTASPAALSHVTWGGACSGTASTCTVQMNQLQSVTARFDLNVFTLTVNLGGDASGTVTGSGARRANNRGVARPGVLSPAVWFFAVTPPARPRYRQ